MNKILIIEDDEAIAEIEKDILRTAAMKPILFMTVKQV